MLSVDGVDGVAAGQSQLNYLGTAQGRKLNHAVKTLRAEQALRIQQQAVQEAADATMSQAQKRGQIVLAAAINLRGPDTAFQPPSSTPSTCPDKVPDGALLDGAAEIGAKKLCIASVKQARTPAAAAAIVWAFNHLGQAYSMAGLPIDNENLPEFNCANFVGRAYFWGARIGGFKELGWTPAFALPPPFIVPIGQEYRSGDINIMWKSSSMSDSAGKVGHAQLFIADGWLIQSGGTGKVSNVAKYPNGWGGWHETHFAVDALKSGIAGQ